MHVPVAAGKCRSLSGRNSNAKEGPVDTQKCHQTLNYMRAFLVAIWLVVLIVPRESVGQFRYGDDVVIDDAVDHDIYVAGGTVTINAPIRGDLIVAGGTININDSVTHDLLVAGGNIIVNGVVADDIRCAGGKIRLNSTVLGDFVVTGGDINIARNAAVAGSLLSSGGAVTLDGNIKGNARIASGTFALNGVVERELGARSGAIVINGKVHGPAVIAAETIDLGDNAAFQSDVRYWSKSGSLDFGNSLQGGKATYDVGMAMESGKWHYLGFASVMMLLWYLGMAFVMIFVIQHLFGQTLENAANTIRSDSIKSLGLGFLFLIGVPIAIVILFITLIGIPIAIVTLLGFLAIILFATVITSLVISNWINNTYYQSSWRSGRISVVAFVIFVILKLGSLTPFIGPLVMFLFACMAFGGILLNVRWRRDTALA